MNQAHHLTATNGAGSCNTSKLYGITNLRINRLGVVAFDCKFDGTQKSTDFVICSLRGGSHWQVTFKGENRIGYITLAGDVFVTHEIQGGAFTQHLSQARRVLKLNAEALFNLKTMVLTAPLKQAGSWGRSARVVPMILVD